MVNVRLGEDHLRKARILRERGVVLSDLVREAIDARFQALSELRPVDVGPLIDRLFERYPDPPDLPPRGYDVHDARAARTAVLRRLSRGS